MDAWRELSDHKDVDPRAFGWLVGSVDGEGHCVPLIAIRCVAMAEGVPDWKREPGPAAELVPCGLSVVGVYAGCDGTCPAADHLTSLLTAHVTALKTACSTVLPIMAAILPGEVNFFKTTSLSPLVLEPAVIRREAHLAEFAATHVGLRAQTKLHLQVEKQRK
jgi:hypothetical protein